MIHSHPFRHACMKPEPGRISDNIYLCSRVIQMMIQLCVLLLCCWLCIFYPYTSLVDKLSKILELWIILSLLTENSLTFVQNKYIVLCYRWVFTFFNPSKIAQSCFAISHSKYFLVLFHLMWEQQICGKLQICII